MFRVLSWNIRQGGGSRLSKIVATILEEGAEVVVLSEYRNNHSGAKIRNALLSGGYRYQGVTAAPADVNSAAIFSKLPGDISLYPDSDPTYSHNVLSIKFDAFSIFGMYLPHKKKHALFDLLIEKAEAEHPTIMVGDMNTGINGVDQKGSSFWYEDKLKKLETIGYRDAFRAMHGSKQEYSWYSHQGNGYRYDHTYLDETLLPIVKDCYYIHEWRENKLSDHSPMVLVLG